MGDMHKAGAKFWGAEAMTGETNPMTDTQAGLLPCPFCGRDAERVNYTDRTIIWCTSPACSVQPRAVSYISEQHAYLLWNTRPSPPASAEVVERVARHLWATLTTIAWDETTEPFRDRYRKIAAECIEASGAAVQVPDWTQMAQAMQRIGACGTEDEIASLLCNAAAPQKQGA